MFLVCLNNKGKWEVIDEKGVVVSGPHISQSSARIALDEVKKDINALIDSEKSADA